ncbi:MAG: HD domain-containing protein [Candidatus Latescibacteria bacterium]|nr:HD domain-containing protein [bacterium]MBD3423003.1 HD domain-containing protein [Candidatus Latescibacterota bacterium]
MMSKAQFERIKVDQPDTALFRISGRLGFHENGKVEQLSEECLKRKFKKVVFDFLELSSLGGGVARIFRDFVSQCERDGCSVIFVVDNEVVLDFLVSDDSDIRIMSTVEEAMGAEKPESPEPGRVEQSAAAEESPHQAESEGREDSVDEGVIILGHSFESEDSNKDVENQSSAVPVDEEVNDSANPPVDESGDTSEDAGSADGNDEELISEIFNESGQKNPPEWINTPKSPFSRNKAAGLKPQKGSDVNRQLKRRVLELETLFSISSDFNSIYDKKKFLDIFLLTSIAQGGIESALFLERDDDRLKPIVCKGSNRKEILDFSMSLDSVSESAISEAIHEIDSLGDKDLISPLIKNDFKFFYPFVMDNRLIGIFIIGKRISGRKMEKEDFEFLNILANVAQGAYRNVVMLEEEHERTLGIVKTLISMIEENTLLKGTSEFVSRYVGIVAKKMNYPQEDFKDLIYGTVLRDMGMIKISDLIIKSPRELTKEEWDIVKRHPDDGAKMLERMKFSQKVVDVVRCHHERFNGEGYPRGLRGKEIPLGSRIISVVESYSAMIHDRPARVALSEREALDTLKENYGLRYDMEVIRCFVRVMEKEIAKSIKPTAAVSEG